MIISWLVLTFFHNNLGTEGIPANDSNSFGYELLLAKMDFLEYKFLELEVEVKEQIESVLLKQEKSERAVLEQTSDILTQQKVFANHEALKQSIFDLQPKKHPSDNSALKDFLFKNRRKNDAIQSCESEPTKKSGKYWIQLENLTKFQVYCKQTMHGGGWIVIQNRFDGSVDFYRNWTEYKNGFGDLDGEFWLGLDKIHGLTSTKSMKLLIHVEDFNSSQKYVVYSDFAIGSERDKYTLTKLSGPTGSLKDALLDKKGFKFSTFDDDNTEDCTSVKHGAWWYDHCSYSNLNGLYKNEVNKSTMSWYKFSEEYRGLKISKMMIK